MTVKVRRQKLLDGVGEISVGKDVVVVQLLSRVRLFATPWTAARQVYLSFTISWSLLKLMSIESVMSSNCLNLCCPLLLLPCLSQHQGPFQDMKSWIFISGGQNIRASASVRPMNIRG